MSWVAAGVAGAGLVMSYQQQQDAKKAQEEANALQRKESLEGKEMTEEQLAEQQRQFEYQAQIAPELAGSIRQRRDDVTQREQQRFDVMKGAGQARLDPYSQAGAQAQGRYSAMMGLSGEEAQQAAYDAMRQSPAQKWQEARIMKSVERQAARQGRQGGGRVLTELQSQAGNIAGQREEQVMSRLQGLAGAGQQAATSQATMLGAGPGAYMGGGDVGIATSQPGARADFTADSGGGAPKTDRSGNIITQKSEDYDPTGTVKQFHSSIGF